MEGLKLAIDNKRVDIIREMGVELDRRNIGGDAYQSTRILDQVNSVQSKITEMLNRPGVGLRNGRYDNGEVDEAMFLVGYDDDVPGMNEEVEEEPNEVGVVATRRFQLSWSNVSDGVIRFLPKDYTVFPIMRSFFLSISSAMD